MFNTPILLLVFNRPEETQRVFEEVRKVQPKQLFISADGARAGRSDDVENSQAVREIFKNVDWDCEVKTLYREQNLGCRNAVSEGITWFFNNVEEGIILEDDCLPHPTFFSYCETLLEYYRTDESIMHIGANNFQDGIKRGDGSYYFSKIPHVWGWASWRRAWQHYDINFAGLGEVAKTQLPYKNSFERSFWLQTFKRVQNGEINTWDYQWSFALLKIGGKAIIPQSNLVTNIGFGGEATHTNKADDKLNAMKVEGVENIVHPLNTTIQHEADYYWYKKIIPWQLKLKSWVKYYFS